jgi:O-succinylbenzoic acid--CoA ligase
MDASLLTSEAFWADPEPFSARRFPGNIPPFPELRGHVLFETSGSTGSPKWIALSKTALLASAVAVNRHLGVTESSCWGLALPLQHVGGFGVAARAFVAHCALREFDRRWDPAAFREWIETTQVTHTSLVPTQVFDLVAIRARSPGQLRAVIVGGGKLEADTGRSARALGWQVLSSFGMTEAGSQIATQGLDSLTTLYQPAPIPLLPIWQADTSPLGLLRIMGPALFSGVLVWENGTWAFKPVDSGWHQTDDRVELEERDLTPLGRADTQIKVMGELVDLEAIERELEYLSVNRLPPGSFAVVAVPDQRAGSALVPVFDASVDPATIAEVLSAYKSQAPGFRRLQPAVILDEFPRSSLGKPRRGSCREMLLHLRSELGQNGDRQLPSMKQDETSSFPPIP